MSALVGALRAMLTLDSTAFVDGSKKAQRSQKDLESGLKRMQRTMRRVAVGMAAAGAGLAVAIKGQLNAADEMGKMAQKFGVPVEELSRLKYAADLAGVPFETLGVSLAQLSKKMVGQPQMFRDLGIEVTDASGAMRSTEAVLQDVAGVFASMPEGAEKTALAMKLFGRSGSEMIPLLNSGKSGLQEMAEEANKLGIVITDETAAAAEQFNDNLSRMQAALGGLVVQLTAKLAPSLAIASEWFIDIAKKFRELSPETLRLSGHFGAVAIAMTGVAIAFKAAAFLFAPVKVAIAGISAAFAGLVAAARLVLVAITPVNLAIVGVAAGAVLIYDNWEPISAWFKNFWEDLGVVAEAAWQTIKEAIGGAIDWLAEKWDAFVGKITAAIDTAKAAGKAIADAMKFDPNSAMNQFEQDYGSTGIPAANSATSNSFSSNSRATGVAGANGMIAGFKETIAARLGEIAAAAEEVTRTVKRQWQVQSPSRVFREIGQFLTEGLSLGIKDNVPMVDAAMGEVGDTLAGRADSFKSALESFKSTAESAFVGLVTGALSFKEALSQVISKLAEMLAQKAFSQLFGDGFFGAIMGAFGFADGAAFNRGKVTAFASGGIVNGATAFGMQGGLGVMGEAGPEAIMPLTRIGGKLGVLAEGGGATRVRVEVVEGEMFASRVQAIADDRAVQVVKTYDREVLPQTRGRNGRERG